MKVDKDMIIIGGGPAGLTAAQYGSRANLNVLLLEEMAPGGQGLLIDTLENYPGFPEAITGIEFSQQMEKQAIKFGTEIITTTAGNLKKEGNIFSVETSKGTFTSYTVILATGAKHRLMDVPGEKEFTGKGVSYCATCDGPFFRNKKILVVGGGDAACDEAQFLSAITNNVIIIHRKERFRAQRSLANRVLNNKNIEVRFKTILREIKGDTKVKSVLLKSTDTGKEYEQQIDAVFAFIGIIPQNSLVPDLEKDDSGYIVTNQRMETEMPGLYTIGDLRSTPFRQIVVASGEGAIAAHCAVQYIDELKGEAYK